MILKNEIEKIAEKKGVTKATIDKDWVLDHFIDAIFSVPGCRKQLVFKGGTCLRKCYFPDYRFSEDIDFTSINPEFELSKKLLNEITGLISERTEVPLHIQELAPVYFKDQLTGYRAIVKFWGSDHPRNQVPPSPERWTTSIKIEIILYEKMSFPAEERKVNHPYTDQLSQTPLYVPCYSLYEVLAEKLRSLIHRSYTAPRDLFDIWYLEQHVKEINWSYVVEAFHNKMAFKGIEFTGTDQMINEEKDMRLRAAWVNSLRHQVAEKDIADYETVKTDIIKLLEKIFK